MTYQFMRCAAKTCTYESPYFDVQNEKAYRHFLAQKGLIEKNEITHCPLCQQDTLVTSQAEQMCMFWDDEGEAIAFDNY